MSAHGAPPETAFTPFRVPDAGAQTGAALDLDSGPLPAHRAVRIRLRVAIEGTWDGAAEGDGPDVLTVRLDDGRLLWRTTFAASGRQSYPDRVLEFDHPAGTGMSDSGECQLDCIVPHRAERLRVRLQATLNESLPENRDNPQNESWRLSAADYAVLRDPPSLPEASAFQALWAGLSNEDPAVAWAAVDALLAADPEKMLAGLQAEEKRQNSAAGRGPDRQTRLADLVARLDQGDWRIRAAASKELAALTAEDVPLLKSLRTEALSLEARLELDEAIHTLGGRSPAGTPESRRLIRLRYLLQLMDRPAAREWLRRLPDPAAVRGQPPPAPARRSVLAPEG